MFGKNEIVGQKYFSDANKNQLFVTSMFMTLQGEGPYRGEPAFFIRLAKCNLACSFCDTFFDDGDWLTFSEIEDNIESAIEKFYADKGMVRPNWTYHDSTIQKRMVLVITGGEPTLQANLGPFLERMSSVFSKTQIESNGIVHQPTIPLTTTIVISPKCNERDGVAIKYLTPHKKNLEVANCLKFVMSADPNSPYYTVPSWAHDWSAVTGKPIYVSPMNIYNDQPIKAKELRSSGVNRIEMAERSTVDEAIDFWEPDLLDMAKLEENHKYVARYCIENGFIFNMQMHLFAGLA